MQQKNKKVKNNERRILKIFIINLIWFFKERLLVFFFVYPVVSFLSLLNNKIRIRFFDHFNLNKKMILLKYRKIRLVLFYRDLETYKEIFESSVYDRFDLKRDWIVIDCGANIGLYTIKVAPKVKKVISIEPNPHNFNMLLLNLKINRLKNVVPLNLAVYSRKKLIKIYGEGPTSSIFKPRHSEIYEKVVAIPLDSITKELRKIDLLKIDVEGAEIEVLKGASNTLKKTRNLILEVHPFLVDDKKVWEILEKYSFRLKKYSHPDPLISERAYIIVGRKLNNC